MEKDKFNEKDPLDEIFTEKITLKELNELRSLKNRIQRILDENLECYPRYKLLELIDY